LRHASESWSADRWRFLLSGDAGRAGMTIMDLDHDSRLKRTRYRAWHRGTREADMMIGGFFDAHHAGWTPAELDWFEALLEEQDVDVMGWAIGSIPCPPEWECAMMTTMRSITYVEVQR
jgi:antitoxin CptB